MTKKIAYVSAFLFLNDAAAFASVDLTASVTGQVSTPTPGTNMSITVSGGDRFTVVLGTTLGSSTITPASGTTISITPNGNASRFGVTSSGTVAPAPNFLGMTFANPNLAVRNTNVDTTGTGPAGSPVNTNAFVIGALSPTVLTITAGGGNGVEIKKRATGTTNFGYSSTAPIPLTAYPTNEYAFTATGNAFVTIPITLTALPG